MKKTALFYFLLIGFSIFSCSKQEKDRIIVEIKYGTSFGECLGYCIKNMTLNPGLLTYSRAGWIDTIKTVTCSEVLEDSDWNSFLTEIDVASFFNMPETIGCPDCADGGAEWIEVKLANGEKHKVTFEYMNEPTAFKDYISGLRGLFEESQHCAEY